MLLFFILFIEVYIYILMIFVMISINFVLPWNNIDFIMSLLLFNLLLVLNT